MSILDEIKNIMLSFDQWMDATMNYESPAPGILARTPSCPPPTSFHYSSELLINKIKQWSVEVLPTLSYDDLIYDICKLRDILAPGSGRDYYLIGFIIECIDKKYRDRFMDALVGGVLCDKISTHIINDPDSSMTNEKYFHYLYRHILNNYKYNKISLIFVFIRMIKYNNIDYELVTCDDFSSRYTQLFSKEGNEYKYVRNPKDFLFNEVILDEKSYKFYNNPKKIFDLTYQMIKEYNESKDLSIVEKYVNKYYKILDNKESNILISI